MQTVSLEVGTEGSECRVIDESGVDELVAELLDPGRTVPVLVASKDPDHLNGAKERGDALIHVVRGVANVWALEGLATSELSKRIGADLHVFHGAVRTYLPGLAVPDSNPRRHRFAGRDLFIENPRRGARVVGRSLLTMATSARPPAIYRDVVHDMPGFTRQGADREALLADLVSAEAMIDELKQALEGAYLEAHEAAVEADRAEARARWLEDELAAHGAFLTGIPAPGDDEIVTVASCEEALIYASTGLSYVAIGDTEEPAEAIDRHLKGPMWARKAWDSFQSLQSYALAKADGSFHGNFLTYCQSSSPPGHRISADWVAQGESESVNNNPTYRSARVFPVPAEVDPDGKVYMDQHIRLEKGSDPAPRIHFYDDTVGATGKIYVGYFGRHLPSGQSN
ncbi:MAG: hypothetical protein HKL85_00105 [Acidimicrobiaceae bacterium]|nr:hypothetical protein [Acidimicrobiaceae bacterium]